MKYLLFGLLSMIIVEPSFGKVITNSYLWSSNTRVYYLEFETTKKIINLQVFKPQGITLQLITTDTVILAQEIAAIKDVKILFAKNPILLILTVKGQLLAIDINSKVVNVIKDFKLSARQNFAGFFTISYSGEQIYIVVVNNTNGVAMEVLALSPEAQLLTTPMVESWQHIFLPNAVSKIMPALKLVLESQTRQIFARVKTLTGEAILAVDLTTNKISKLFKLEVKPKVKFILLDLQQQQHIEAIASCNTVVCKISSYLPETTSFTMAEQEINGNNIRDLLIGPAINVAWLSWYLLEQENSKYLLRSNNFPAVITLPLGSQLLLRHGELLVFASNSQQIWSIAANSGNIEEIKALEQWQAHNFTINLAKAKTLLFWEPIAAQHILVNIAFGTITTKSFVLTYDKAKILSWRKAL